MTPRPQIVPSLDWREALVLLVVQAQDRPANGVGGHSVPHGNCVAFGTLVQLTLEGATEEEFLDVQEFCLEVGLPVTLSELGVKTDDEIRTIAKNACVPGETIHNLAGDVTPDELYAAIVATDAIGRAVQGLDDEED